MSEASVRFGDEVRARCTATGRYIGRHGGKHWVLYISCMDNDLGLDEANFDMDPQPNLPQPCDRALSAAAMGFRHGIRLAPAVSS